MRWYIPSFNGDFRFEQQERFDGKMREETTLTVERPTPGEIEALKRYGKRAVKERWVAPEALDAFVGDLLSTKVQALTIHAKLDEAAAPMAKILGKGKVGLITALAFEDGRVKITEVVEETDLPRWMRKAQAETKVKATAAVTVSRPRLSCPECSGRSEGERKACDVLWDFLDPFQRKEWLSDRRFTAYGSHTEHAYDIATRDTARAAARGRIVFDMDDRVILHNFDLTLPPEEEALQAKLMIEHREHWIRVQGEVDPSWRATPGTIFPNVLPPIYS